ncbi:MAG: DNA-directed RNA polymerase subunit L [Candidatus Bathyarchaeia archaeon]|nr:DNA-directed RNA polymerase subunit L [Candidatus Bathyarchaeota archaeon]
MQIRVLEKKENEVVLEIEGEGHTLCNLLESVLLEDRDVEFAGYTIPHPLVGKPILRVRTRGDKKPKEALREALTKIVERGRKLGEEFERVFREYDEAHLR